MCLVGDRQQHAERVDAAAIHSPETVLIGCLAGGCGFGSVDCELIRDTQFLPLRRWRTRGRSSESGQRQEIGRGVCSTSWLQRIGTGGARPPGLPARNAATSTTSTLLITDAGLDDAHLARAERRRSDRGTQDPAPTAHSASVAAFKCAAAASLRCVRSEATEAKVNPSASRRDAVVPSGVWIPAAMPALAAASRTRTSAASNSSSTAGSWEWALRRRVEGPTGRCKCRPDPLSRRSPRRSPGPAESRSWPGTTVSALATVGVGPMRSCERIGP